MSIQKIAASVTSLNQETNVGLVHFNFDFALNKYEAPLEFQGLGRELSQARIKAAEDGAVHITARKLGALFRQCLPSTSHLIKAYGTRASEIASDPKVNPKLSRKHGVLADHVGIDGTSIWAAATSGAESIAVHLLACMLARIWSRPEAIAIWAELVWERKKELERTDVADPQYLMALNDSRIDITRDQLAQWDSSARAWLQCADEAMKIKQTQLMLIVNNVNLPVSTKPTLYRNMLQAWSSAMLAADNLIRGVPQSVEYGSILLGISSWHIYPDMVVLQSSPTPISQSDPLRPSETGISWSLPLGHLRYYGGPAVTEKSFVIQGNRITVTQLIQLSIGCMTRHWSLSESTIVKFLVVLWKFIEPVTQKTEDGTAHWLWYLAEAAMPLLDPESLDAQVGFRLMKLGARRCHQFLGSQNGKPTAVPKLLGQDDVDVVTRLLVQPEDSVHLFRELVKYPALNRFHNRLFIIRYGKDFDTPVPYTTFEYATALPLQGERYKRSHDGEQQIVLNPARHCRWIQTDCADDRGGANAEGRLKYFRSQNEDSFAYMTDSVEISSDIVQWNCSREQFSNVGILHHANYYSGPNDPAMLSWSEFIDFEHGYISDYAVDNSIILEKSSPYYINFEPVVGSMDTAALLISKGDLTEDLSTLIKSIIRFSPMDFFEAMKGDNNPVSREKTLSYLSELVSMPSSTISLSVVSLGLPEMSWIPSAGASTGEYSPFTQNIYTAPFKLNRPSTFSCLLLLETGGLSVPPSALSEVMAMAVGDSIYIAKGLISDPSKKYLAHEICQIKGSIGKSGIALMIPPKSPLTRPMELSNFQCVNHNPFDGQLHDSFSSTTLHLGFTDYVFPVDVGNHGNKDFEVYYLETLVSVCDRGEWVADLDVLQAMEENVAWTVIQSGHWKQPLFSSIKECEHMNHRTEQSGGLRVASVRSMDNWLGRLAAAAVCRQQGSLVIILPNKYCGPCLCTEWTRLSTPPDPKGESGIPRIQPDGLETPALETGEIEVVVNGVRELRMPAYVKNNIMNQGSIFLIC
ncbi:hypothetical protein F5Y03DRAFT_403671 [Xylaria venustula]|nr:hypothetical protein F5Y03DRAFT_403671 [Xylaria venustula]